MGELAVIAIVAVAGFAMGMAARSWWALFVAALPTVSWLALTLPGWTEEDSDGVTGFDFFLAGFAFLGAPLIVGCAAGVLIARRRMRGRPTVRT